DLLLERLDRPLDAAEVYRDLLARLPDDLAALRGLSEALGAAGDVEGTLAALDAEVDAQRDLASQLVSLLRLAAAAEAFDRPDEAEDACRRAVLAAPGSAHAGVGLLEVMVRRKDAAGELAALEGLAAAPGEIGAALGERAGWLALASGEVDRAG